jgi:hypothetical protein
MVSRPYGDRNALRKCNGVLSFRSFAMLSAHEKK